MVQKGSQPEPRPRGRPRAYNPEAALQRATESFWRAGYSATSLDDLSAATGMNRPSLYGAFGDKRELYLAALARYWEISRGAMQDALAYDRPLRDALRRLYRKALAGYFGGKDGARGCFAIGTATTEALRDAKIRVLLAEGFQMIDDAFAARIRFARDHGDLPNGADPATLAMLASATLHTLAIRSRAGAARSRLEAMADATVEVICGPAPVPQADVDAASESM
jgi:TetR/AcrR family transcriptional regulator, copper-responsive repressor